MKRREFIKFVGGGTLALSVPALSEPIKGAGPVPEVDAINSISLADIKNAIACLYKNKCQTIQPMGEYVFYSDPGIYEDVAKTVDSYNKLIDARSMNQNYLKLRKSRF